MASRLRESDNCSKPLELGTARVPQEGHLARVTSVRDRGIVELGNAGLMLNIITPLLKSIRGGTTINDVLRQRSQDLFDIEFSPDSLAEIEESYTKKKEVKTKNARQKMQLVI